MGVPAVGFLPGGELGLLGGGEAGLPLGGCFVWGFGKWGRWWEGLVAGALDHAAVAAGGVAVAWGIFWVAFDVAAGCVTT